jgi:hypothetical protein
MLAEPLRIGMWWRGRGRVDVDGHGAAVWAGAERPGPDQGDLAEAVELADMPKMRSAEIAG